MLFEILYCMVGSVSIIFGFVHQVLEVLFFNSNGHRKVLSLMKIGWYLICYTISNSKIGLYQIVWAYYANPFKIVIDSYLFGLLDWWLVLVHILLSIHLIVMQISSIHYSIGQYSLCDSYFMQH